MRRCYLSQTPKIPIQLPPLRFRGPRRVPRRVTLVVFGVMLLCSSSCPRRIYPVCLGLLMLSRRVWLTRYHRFILRFAYPCFAL
ncbi:hypothetical protein BDZ85DRAFT_270793 [Elsinoe ampelina]|uniref:Uncharacterized protein n=1 Tax=Elsinoe ampelina TaxID=302913 RepID=A0A6A6FXQ4_9PEZI|nr:hypothetical protein BDZ85DRAFT_270793 [Elsinoe ampelina]